MFVSVAVRNIFPSSTFTRIPSRMFEVVLTGTE
jgi:hypothetical protein